MKEVETGGSIYSVLTILDTLTVSITSTFPALKSTKGGTLREAFVFQLVLEWWWCHCESCEIHVIWCNFSPNVAWSGILLDIFCNFLQMEPCNAYTARWIQFLHSNMDQCWNWDKLFEKRTKLELFKSGPVQQLYETLFCLLPKFSCGLDCF